jgi:hypothetical protein
VTVVEDCGGTIMQKTEVLKQKKGVSLNAKKSESELACAEEELRRLVKKGMQVRGRARPARARERDDRQLTQATASGLTEALEDVFGHVVNSTPDSSWC